jgi:hypothetical protein
MPSVWVKWRLSPFEYSEISINDALREVSPAVEGPSVRSATEVQNGKTNIVETKGAVYVLCRRCCKTLGLPVHGQVLGCLNGD